MDKPMGDTDGVNGTGDMNGVNGVNDTGGAGATGDTGDTEGLAHAVYADDAWHLADHENWHGEAGYNEAVADALRCAHGELRGNPAEASAYANVLACLAPILRAEMSSRQRLHVLFVAALATAEVGPRAQAIDLINEALELALALDEERAQEELLILRASVNRALLQVPDAADDLSDCLDLLARPDRAAGARPERLNDYVNALLDLAGSRFVLGEVDVADQLLTRAARLIPGAVGREMATALLSWTRALLLRWRGELELALTDAMAAADGYAAGAHPGRASRIQSIVAEIAMDLAERFRLRDQPLAFEAFMALAEPYVRRAFDLALSGDLETSAAMASVTRSRRERLRGLPGDRGPALEEIASLGRQNQDMALVAQAYTELGAEHEAAGDVDGAVRCYRRVLAVVNEARMTALGVWAQRALWRLEGETRAADAP